MTKKLNTKHQMSAKTFLLFYLEKRREQPYRFTFQNEMATDTLAEGFYNVKK